VRLQTGSLSDRQRTLETLHSALLPLSPAEIEDFLDIVAGEVGVTWADRASHRPMDPDELTSLHSSPLAEIGAHSVWHPDLATLPPHEQRREIVGSRQRLEEQLNAPVRAFAYPFGELGQGTPGLVKDAGFELACTVEPGKVVPTTDPFLIPRYEVHDWGEQEFTDRVRHWLAR
jgi:peptidoglycan/xylan/chitin deacetylase (PgdA/CDA1 family)